MNDELKSLYKLKDGLERDLEAALNSLPEKKALDHTLGLIAFLQGKSAPAERESAKIISIHGRKPRTLVGIDERAAMLEWLDNYFCKNNNRPATFRQLTDLMLADGLRVPGPPDKQIFVVVGLVSRNKRFKGKNGLWHLAKFAA